MIKVIGKFGLKVGVNGLENCKGHGKMVKLLWRSEVLNACEDLLQPMHVIEPKWKVKLPMEVLHCHQVQLDRFLGYCGG